jgi:conjugative transfer region protein TrbK
MGFRPDPSLLVKGFALGIAAFATIVALSESVPESLPPAWARADRPGSAPIPPHCRGVTEMADADAICRAAWKANLEHFLQGHELTAQSRAQPMSTPAQGKPDE